jgi:hypothetical protein
MANPSGTKRIVFSRPNGELSIDIPIESIATDPTKLAAHEARIAADHPTWTHEGTVEDTDLPTRHSRSRNAWRWVGGAVTVDLPTVRNHIMEYMRYERNRKLNATDGMQLKANEAGSAQDQTDWNNHRQALRDLTTTVQSDIDALTTAAALESYVIPWPTPPEEPGATGPQPPFV